MKYFIELSIVLALVQGVTMISKAFLFKTPTCDRVNPDYLRNVSMFLTNNRLNFDSYLIKPLHPDARIDLKFFARKFNSKNYQTIYQCSLSLCSVLNNSKTTIMKKWMNTLIKHGNFRTKCPIHASRYYLKDFTTSLLDVPSFLFNGFYRFSVVLIQTKKNGKEPEFEFLIECLFDIEVKEK